VVADELISYETKLTNGSNIGNSFFRECKGKAIKVLSPQVFQINPFVNYKMIWMFRSAKEQAKSQIKFLKAVDGRTRTKQELKERIKSIKKHNTAALAAIEKRGNIELAKVKFESLLRSPRKHVLMIRELLGYELDVNRSISCVLRRKTSNFNGFLEAGMLRSGWKIGGSHG